MQGQVDVAFEPQFQQGFARRTEGGFGSRFGHGGIVASAPGATGLTGCGAHGTIAGFSPTLARARPALKRMRSFSLRDFDFELPPGLIAQHPATERSASR